MNRAGMAATCIAKRVGRAKETILMHLSRAREEEVLALSDTVLARIYERIRLQATFASNRRTTYASAAAELGVSTRILKNAIASWRQRRIAAYGVDSKAEDIAQRVTRLRELARIDALRRLRLEQEAAWLIVSVVACWPVAAQSPRPTPEQALKRCEPAVEMARKLRGQFYREAPIGYGVATDGRLLQLWTREDGAGWTIVATSAKGQSCVIANGRNWQVLPFPPSGRGV